MSSFRLKINPHGLFGMFAVCVMIAIAFARRWDIPWLYFVSAVLLYSAVVIGLSLVLEHPVSSSDSSSDEDFRFNVYRVLLGSHTAFLFLAVGMALGFESFWMNLGFFLASIGGGLAVPFLLFKRG